MNQDLLKHAEEQGFDDFEECVKEMYVSEFLSDLKNSNALGMPFSSNPEAKLTLTGIKFNEFEYGMLCSYFLARDNYGVVETLVEHTGMEVPKESIYGSKLRHTNTLINSSKKQDKIDALNNLEQLTKVANKKSKTNPEPLSYNPEQIQEIHSKYLKQSDLGESAKLMKVTDVEPKTKDIFEALEKRLLL